MNIIKDLIKLADQLDRKGLHSEADIVDQIISKAMEEKAYSVKIIIETFGKDTELSPQDIKQKMQTAEFDDLAKLENMTIILSGGDNSLDLVKYEMSFPELNREFLEDFIADLEALEDGVNSGIRLGDGEDKAAIDDFETIYNNNIQREETSGRVPDPEELDMKPM